MFDFPIKAALANVKATAKPDGPTIVRRIKFALERDFDVDIDWGGTARDVRLALLEGQLEKAVIPLDGIEVSMVLEGRNSTATVERARGLRATATAVKDKDDNATPKVKLEFELPFEAEVWVFLGRSLGEHVLVTLSRRQLNLPGMNGSAAKADQANGAAIANAAEKLRGELDSHGFTMTMKNGRRVRRVTLSKAAEGAAPRVGKKTLRGARPKVATS